MPKLYVIIYSPETTSLHSTLMYHNCPGASLYMQSTIDRKAMNQCMSVSTSVQNLILNRLILCAIGKNESTFSG